MPSLARKLNSLRCVFKRRKPLPDVITEEKWTADFSRPKQARFEIKSESSYDANLRKNPFDSGYLLALSLKKTGCIAWTEAPENRYRDLTVSGRIRIDSRGGYSAGGIFFRMVDDETYYSFLVSSKGYFRLEAVRNGMPFPLVGWTELPISSGATLGPDQPVDFSVIAFGSHIIVLIKGRWAAEINDSSILEGSICFAAASYESGDPTYSVIREADCASYSSEIFLESITVDSRIDEVSSLCEKWRNNPDIDSKARLNLAETFTAMNQHNAAMIQIRKSWEAPGHKKTQKELLLAGRLAQLLGQMTEAERYVSECFQENIESPEGKDAVVEMAKIINAGERFEELKEFCTEAINVKATEPLLWNFKGHAHWNLKEYRKAATAYDQAFELDRENGILAKNAANVYDVMDRKKEALKRYLEAGKVFLRTGNYNDLGLVVPKLLSIGDDNWEARSLTGKWNFAVEEWKTAGEEFAKAEELRKAKRPKPPKDGAQVFLEALLLIMAGKRRDALPLLEEAAHLEKDYALFHFRLAENLFIMDDDPYDPKMLKEMETALALCHRETKNGEGIAAKENEGLDGWINNFAAQVALRSGNLDAAFKHLAKARNVLGDQPAVRVNQGLLLYLKGSMDEALAALTVDKQSDPEGIMANCAGNLLVRSERFEEADERYLKALSCQPENIEYLSNRAACLMEQNLFGEADSILAKAHEIAPSPDLLEMISYVAAKKGEYPRAEEACRAALKMDPLHAPSLLSLGWILLAMGEKAEAGKIVPLLDKLHLKDNTAKGRDELRARLDELRYQSIGCASCSRTWKVLKESPSVPAIRLFAMPPDNLPAGSCSDCGKTYCIGCAKEKLDPQGRFVCPSCNRPLKLVNDGLKELIHDWVVKDGLINTQKTAEPEKRSKGRPKKTKSHTIESHSIETSRTELSKKRGRGRPKKNETPTVEKTGKRGRGRPRKS